MKKVFTLCLTLIMVMTMSITAFAAPGAFVESPSGNAAPQLISFSNLNANCTADLTVTSYADRNSLSESDRRNLKMLILPSQTQKIFQTLIQVFQRLHQT